jgi:glycosyltransferase involved in cell wall biosynthesis
MDGKGANFLARSLLMIEAQSYTDHETVVSDHSIGDEIKRICAHFPKVRYIRNPERRGNSSANLNNAIDHAKGDTIKIVFQDDFLAGPDSLARMVDGMGDKAWLVHSYSLTDIAGKKRHNPTQPYIPEPYEKLIFGNSVGAPTAIMFKNCDLRFDENLIWRMDCEFYYRLLRMYGLPAIVKAPLAVQTIWRGQVTNKIDDTRKESEDVYLEGKHGFPSR